MFCPSCGGEYADWAQKCPYCGSVNEQADESLYLQHLATVRHRLDRVDEEAETVYRTQISHSMKRTARKAMRIFLWLLAATAILTAVYSVKNRIAEQRRIDQMVWERQMFEQLDAWYASGDYDRIAQENDRVLREGRYDIFDWPHYYFVCEYYRDHTMLQTVSQTMESGKKPESYELGEAIYAGMRFQYEMTDSYIDQLQHSFEANGAFGLTEQEAQQVRLYRQEAGHFFRDTLEWSEDDLQVLHEKIVKDGYVRVSPCFDVADQLLKEWEG